MINRFFKKILRSAAVGTICALCLFAQTVVVYAQGSITISSDYLHLYVGDERHFTINANNAVGSVDIVSSNEEIASVDQESVWLDNNSAVITVRAKKAGICNISVKVVDGATYDEEVIASTYTITVEVTNDLGPQEVNVPTADHDSGEVSEGTKIALNCSTPDAIIHYSFNGGEYKVYEDELVISKDLLNDEDMIELDIYASKEGNYIDSGHFSYSYTIKEKEEDYGDLLPEDREEYDDAAKIPEGFWISGLKDYDYTGKAIKQENIRVFYHTVLLTEKKDYTVSYKNNINASNKGASIIVNGRGNYSGSFTDSFSIKALDLSDAVTDDQTLKYSETKAQNILSKIVLYGKTLRKNTDYTLSLEKLDKGTEAGVYAIQAEGKGNYTGTVSFNVYVTDKKPISEVATAAIKNITYDGTEHRPEVIFREFVLNKEKIQLREGIDYTVEYDEDCTNAGTHRIVVRAKGNSSYVAGTKVLTYRIIGINLSSYNNADLSTKVYTGEEIFQTDPRLYKKVKNGTSTVKEYLEPEGNYTYAYSNNIKAGTATIVYTGINGYTGTIKKTFKITQTSLEGATVSMNSSYEYEKGGVCPDPVVNYKGIQLIKDVDYKVTYKNNNKINDNSNSRSLTSLTISGKGNFTGTLNKQFVITAKDLTEVVINAEDCTAGKVKASIKLYDTNGKNLSSSDYYVSKVCYDENVKLSNGTQRYKGEPIYKSDSIPANTVLRAYVKGKGSYTGARSVLFKTYEKRISGVTAVTAAQEYTGKEITLSKDDIVLKSGKTVLSKNDYDIIGYKNNVNRGNAFVTIKGKGIYGGTKDIRFVIGNKSMNLKIVFDGNGASSGRMTDQVMNAPLALRANGFKKTGYRFEGWSTEKNGASISFTDKEVYPYLRNDAGKTIVLYAVWSKIEQ